MLVLIIVTMSWCFANKMATLIKADDGVVLVTEEEEDHYH